ncbi:hypothetical protein SCP_0313390 [Sparassis crispa]|uniref:Uncharacterized protein n=1 Tax=Sparassis crispa TaxID=139825 RepID=A0A401GHF2_9APHY|nr:hypothetical protein SCP_0313390 [Sparassis crispa]GBE81610.1 hypothetical protein SCP_0313390 [Sparassis crispa]
MVKELIPDDDLQTHVSFYHSHVLVANLYCSDKDENELWHRACWLSGLGLTRHQKPDEVSWKAIAFNLIQKDGSCTNRECGTELLRANARRMVAAIEEKQLIEEEQDQFFDGEQSVDGEQSIEEEPACYHTLYCTPGPIHNRTCSSLMPTTSFWNTGAIQSLDSYALKSKNTPLH